MKAPNAIVVVAVSLVLSLLTFDAAECFDGDYYLHTTSSDVIDNVAPTVATAKFKDSPAINRTTYRPIGEWTAAPLGAPMRLESLGELRVWIGLKNSDDQGTYFDLKAEVIKNGTVIASGESKNIQGVTRNPSLAKEVAITFGAITLNQFSADDVLSIRILAKVADSGGHNNAVGLRLYYDAVSRSSRFGAPPPTSLITITSPASGNAINDYSVLVIGQLNIAPGTEVGVNVNGYVALQDGSEFTALVPVDAQTTSLTAMVTSTSGTALGSNAIPITVQVPTTAPALFFRPSPAIALVSQPVGFTLTSVNPLTRIQLDGNGDGTIDHTGATLQGITVTFAASGLYFPTVSVTEQGGAVRTATTIVQVFDSGELDTLLQNKWTTMKNALRSGNVSGAASHIVLRRRSTYEAMFNAFIIPLANIDQVLTNITFRNQRGIEAEYEMMVNQGGVQYSYMVLFAIDEDGVWRVKFF
jgi:hypothetical protein